MIVKRRFIGFELNNNLCLYIDEALELGLYRSKSIFLEEAVLDKIDKLIHEGKLIRKFGRK